MNWEKEFFERFGANKIWVVPSRENVETIFDIQNFIAKTVNKALESQMSDLRKEVEKMKTVEVGDYIEKQQYKFWNLALDEVLLLMKK